MKKIILFLSILCTLSLFSRANNVVVTNVNVTGTTATFNLSWENCWNSTNNINPLYPNNYDGVWLFIKYQNNIDNLWKHAKLSSASGNHSVTGAGGVLQVQAVSDSMGVFVRRTNPGAGNISNASVSLAMGPQVGVGTFNFKVFGVEMVYVPTDTFQIGDGSANGFISQTITATQEGASQSSGTYFTGSPLLPAAFPLGYNAFWCMKYEIGTEQWVDFLNSLTYDQQATRVAIVPNSAIGTNAYGASPTPLSIIEIDTPGLNNTKPAVFGCDFTDDNSFNQTNDGQNIAVSGISKGDYLAYLDWSGLRPMTEVEFEKACRGTRPRVLNEAAWGSATVAAYQRNDLTNTGQATEAAIGAVVNGRHMSQLGSSGDGPARAGLFATATTGRESSGASFYGIMEMSGNMFEFVVALDAIGAPFTGNHGDGSLTALGDANVAAWPSGTVNTGIESRGGDWANTSFYTSISYRNGPITPPRTSNYAGRGIRTQ